MTKTRDISTHDFFKALQQEYICLEIRSQIYIHRGDKDYFKDKMYQKEDAIRTLSKKNRLENILDDGEEYIRVWQDIVPKFGFPKLIYNILNVTDEQLLFPFRGTVVEIIDSGEYAISEHVNKSKKEITVLVAGSKLTSVLSLEQVKRADHRKTDEFYYYYPGNTFNCRNNGIGVLKRYDMENKNADIYFKETGNIIPLHQDDISRIL